ncbi:SRPBCC domain-containing protein [Limnoglobus roseus]|uniref:Polyketide cyclase n=1 Tax=Limnoglobus roseus TaxID=2598579 RepID=A0A5C1AD82_9BACT|nr:SRPBCC domain-containing protein [Limnoglobus roseus]QEL16660.1 polyketide cyclase [Limnoglobus roseus]
MIDAIQVTHAPARQAAVIRFHIPQKELPAVMPQAVKELLAVLGEQGLQPAGPLFNRYLSMAGGKFEFETGFPVDKPVTPSGRVVPGALPAAKVARAVYTGPYDQLHHVWHEFGARVQAGGHSPAHGLWESYVYGPESSLDPTTWRTELNQPLASDNPAALRTEREIAATPREIFAAFERPESLAQWWGPDGFTNTFERFEFKPGGKWVFVMHGPNGTDYPNESVFRETRPDKIAIELVSQPHFTLTVTLTARGDKTHLVWAQEFDSREIAEKLRPICDPANEQNLDRLQAVLAGSR